MNELVVLLLEEIRCWSLLSLKTTYFMVAPDILYFDNDFVSGILRKERSLKEKSHKNLEN